MPRRRAKPADPDIPDVFREMLVEDREREERVTKRRRQEEVPEPAVTGKGKSVEVPMVGAEDDDEDESDIDWEDVDLSTHRPSELKLPGTLELVLNDPTMRSDAGPGRRKITAVDRRIRLEAHKLHLLCLIYYVRLRSRWCNDSTVKENLLPLLEKKTIEQLNHDPSDQQFRRSKLFLAGLEAAVETFREEFKITHQGITAPRWYEPDELKNWKPLPNMEGLMSKGDFVQASQKLSGSRDTGAQLFCAMLRAAGVNARLVCSLQVLPFSFNSKSAPVRALSAMPTKETPSPTPSSSKRAGGLRRPHLHDIVTAPSKSQPLTEKLSTIPILESSHPVYWVEAWSIPSQKWIAVDPLATGTTGKPSKLEPPMSDPFNTLSYVLATGPDGHTADVTRRYAHAYLSKTRRLRVTSTKGGEKWLARLRRRYCSRGYPLDMDQLEEAELSQKTLSEPIPRNIQDLKGHPVFALKRHLRKNEVIHPERTVGTVSINNKTTEPIFRRQDVHLVRTIDQWYRLGRDILPTQLDTPLKFTAPRPSSKRPQDDRDDEPPPNEPMYAPHQTAPFTAPPCVSGLVPKNSFGNIDLFVPTMLPPGGAHVKHQHAHLAAQILGIDYAGAVTGFRWNGRQAAATVEGVVVAVEYREAMEEVAKGVEWEKEREKVREKGEEALRRWARWMMRLRIRQRLGIESSGGGGRSESDARSAEGGGGGFLPDAKTNEEAIGGGGFLPEDAADDGGGGFIPDGDDEGMLSEDPDMDNEDLDWFD